MTTIDDLKVLAEKHGCNESMIVWFVYIELHMNGAINIFDNVEMARSFEGLYRDLFKRFYPDDRRFDGDVDRNLTL